MPFNPWLHIPNTSGRTHKTIGTYGSCLGGSIEFEFHQVTKLANCTIPPVFKMAASTWLGAKWLGVMAGGKTRPGPSTQKM